MTTDLPMPVRTARRPAADVPQTRKEFTSDQEVRWCPGCGDYIILAAVQGFLPVARAQAREHRVRLRHRLLVAVPVLPRHLRHALDPRPGAGDRHRAGHVAPGPVGLGRDRRRRRPVHRRQPPDPRDAPQRQPDDPAVQQPDLRPDEGPVLPHVGARQDHQVDADGLGRHAVQPDLAGPGRRGHVRGPHPRLRPRPPHRGAAGRCRAPRHGAGRDLPELPDLQRRRLRRAEGQGRGRGPAGPAAARRSRSRSATASGSTTPTPTTRPRRSRSPASTTARWRTSRSGSSARSTARRTTTRSATRSPPREQSRATATSPRCSPAPTPGPSPA